MKKDRSVLWILIAIVLLVIAVLAAVHYAGASAGQAPPAVTTLPSNLPKTEKPAIYLYPESTTPDPGTTAGKPETNLLPESTTRDPGTTAEKPAINLFPETALTVRVTLELDGTLGSTWPEYGDGWVVGAQPDGTLTDADGNTYSYLFWDGDLNAEYDFSEGFCVAGAETGDFLRKALAELGLTPKEYNEMIVYWLPRMENNPYNLISFQSDAYTDAARLTIDPAPDSLLRVFMAWKPLDEPVDVPPQTFAHFERTGFVAVEWGGAEVR